MPEYPDLEKTALGVLSEYGNNPTKALRPFMRLLRAKASLFEEMALDYLNQVAMRLEPEPVGHVVYEAHDANAASVGHTEAEAHIRSADSDERAGQNLIEAHAERARPLINVRKHKRQRKRTPEEIEAAKNAAMVSARAVYGIMVGNRKLGDIAWGELRTLKRQQVHLATSNLMLGIDQAQLAITLELLEASCVVDDTTKKVKEIVAPERLSELVAMAKRLAPARVELGIKRAAEVMEQGHQLEIAP
jgi:hypothetical protein